MPNISYINMHIIHGHRHMEVAPIFIIIFVISMNIDLVVGRTNIKIVSTFH